MRHVILILTALPLTSMAVLWAAESQSPTTSAAATQPDANFHLYLLIGQSNMAGRGTVDAESSKADPRVLMLTKKLEWKPAKDPLHFDKPAAGVGPGLSFGKQMAEANPNVRIGLIPCAVGGTSIDAWKPGAMDKATKTHPYDDMLKRVHEAQKSGVLKGIIWHQGESDRDASATYGQKLTDLVALLRQELKSPELPFVAGEISDFNPVDANGEDGPTRVKKFNDVLQGLAQTIKHYACVSSEGLQHRGDQLHYNTESARILGKRYAEKMIELQK